MDPSPFARLFVIYFLIGVLQRVLQRKGDTVPS
jgi:hypothetical protein